MAGHNLRKTYPPPPRSVLWISLWSTLELPIWYVVCYFSTMWYYIFAIWYLQKGRLHFDKTICSGQQKWLMTIIILTIVAISRNFTIILTNDELGGSHCDWDWAAQEASPEREPWWEESCFGTCMTIVNSVVEIVISSVSRISIVSIVITIVIEPWCGEGCFCTWE